MVARTSPPDRSARVAAAKVVLLSATHAYEQQPSHASAERLRAAEKQMQTALRYPIGDLD